MAVQWYVSNSEAVLGPFSAAEIKAMAVDRRITADSRIRSSVDPAWRSAGSIPGLVVCLQSAPIPQEAVAVEEANRGLDGLSAVTWGVVWGTAILLVGVGAVAVWPRSKSKPAIAAVGPVPAASTDDPSADAPPALETPAEPGNEVYVAPTAVHSPAASHSPVDAGTSARGGSGILQVGRSYTIGVTCFGGATESDLDRGFDIVQSKDDAALRKMFLSGRLVRLEPGVSVLVEDATVFGKAKVRVRGQIDSVWIHGQWVR